MSGIIPKEKLSAYERWELASFDDDDTPASLPAKPGARELPISPSSLAPQPNAKATPPPPTPASPSGPSPEEIEALRAAALKKGFEEGFKTGELEGKKTAASEAAKIAALLGRLRTDLTELENEVAEDLLALAVDIAQRMVHTTLKVKPELLLPIVRDAIAALPNSEGAVSLHLHPNDAALLRQHLPEMSGHDTWRVIDDERLAVGGCRVLCGGSEVDATTASRWRLIVEALGHDSSWLGND
jgi:flagellar assembly protein FliH